MHPWKAGSDTPPCLSTKSDNSSRTSLRPCFRRSSSGCAQSRLCLASLFPSTSSEAAVTNLKERQPIAYTKRQTYRGNVSTKCPRPMPVERKACEITWTLCNDFLDGERDIWCQQFCKKKSCDTMLDHGKTSPKNKQSVFRVRLK